VLLHLIVPAAGVVVFIPVLLAGLGIDFGGLSIQPLGYPATIAPWVIYTWIALGIAVLGYFMVTDKQRIAQTRELFTEVAGGGEQVSEPPTPKRADRG
jgi:hypothetical protein